MCRAGTTNLAARSNQADVGRIPRLVQRLEKCAGQNMPRLWEAARCSPGTAGGSAGLHVVDEHRREIDQDLPPGDDIDAVPDFPVAGFVGAAIALAYALQALIGVPARVEIDVLVDGVVAVAVDRARADQIARRHRRRILRRALPAPDQSGREALRDAGLSLERPIVPGKLRGDEQRVTG